MRFLPDFKLYGSLLNEIDIDKPFLCRINVFGLFSKIVDLSPAPERFQVCSFVNSKNYFYQNVIQRILDDDCNGQFQLGLTYKL